MLFSKNSGLTLAEIARRCGVHPNTITRWRRDNKWDEMGEILMTTRAEQLRRLYNQLKELNAAVDEKPEGQRFPSKAESDTLTQIMRAIKVLQPDLGPNTVIDVFIPFIKFVSKQDPNLAKDVVEMQDAYIKTLIK